MQEEVKRIGRHGNVYLLSNGENITSQAAVKDERNIHGVSQRVLSKRLAFGERNPEALWAPAQKRMKR
jgi:hypothetical protein